MSKRAAIYTRFSSDRQNERSCDDQAALCAAWAERQGLSVTASYQDAAISGASTVNRFGLASLMRDARAGRFDVVLCEALDRLSRDQGDLARLKKELAFVGISIMTVQDGEVGAMHIGLKGLMGELYLADLAQKTRRGQSARVRAGGAGGGRSYGYRPAAVTGEMEVIDEEAAIVRRIFESYLSGRTGRQIAGDLNAACIPGPRGGHWNASTIIGSKSRRNGVLQNRLYVGEIVWNRQRFIKDPSTGRRVSRLNPESEWITAAVPQLAIVEREIFEAVQARREERTFIKPQHLVKPRHLLSGLIKCGCCGASYTVLGRDRLGCAGFRERQDCSNGRTVARRHVELRVLESLQRHLADPEIVAAFVSTYLESRRALAAAGRRERSKLQRRLSELTRQIEQIVDRILAETATAALEARLPALEAEKAALEQQLATLDEAEPPIALHPGAAAKYARIVAEVREELQSGGDPASEAAMATIRDLIERIEILPPPDSKKPVDITVSGLLAGLLLASTNDPHQYRGGLVAGTGFEPVTFRL